ncbi:MAG TPA: YdeI/OmpD-associated family protein [Candidatus Ruania gallistercoris]|uniref:YdeI/OmpD-associated family protein n=1 Tax=Candidatus Ruania gallistercoris TaxID=2838746 RepID=A0A9D2ECE1_9MICO|nr:YdeI/OmpD-associated family protein [Candidatus Ruania gallistercoris]
MTELPELLLPDAAAWRDWLSQNHQSAPGVWLVLTKKGGTLTTLNYEGAVLEALCFGWIDGQARSRDEVSSLQRYTPRRARSQWSAKNVGRVERLEAEGKMRPAGQAQVAAAKKDGRWERAYAGPATAVVPDDLAAAIAASPRAQAMFEVLTSQNRFALLHRLQSVKRASTRASKITTFVDMLAAGETFYPQRRRPSPQ